MIKEKNVVELHYTGKFKDGGEVFDSSVEREPLKVEVGNGSLIKGFEQSLLGKESIIIDGNHPLAGKELLFDIEIVTVTVNESE